MIADEGNSESVDARKMSSGTRIVVIGLVIFTAFAGWSYYLRRTRTHGLDAFAQCLAAKQVKMYGLYWCTHCAEQKAMFGGSFQYVPYTECAIKGARGETPECKQAGLKNFPTWELSGVRYEGVLPLKTLSERSGCSLP